MMVSARSSVGLTGVCSIVAGVIGNGAGVIGGVCRALM